MTRSRKVLRRVLIALVALLVTLAVGAGGLYLFLMSERGRDWLARRIENVYADQVTGTLEIGKIERLRGFAVDATNLRFLDPRAQEIITIEKAHLELEAGALLDGKLLFSNAHAEKARVVIGPGRTYSTSIEDAFGSRGTHEDPIAIDTGMITVERTVLVIAMGGPRVRVGGLNGALRVFREGEDPVRVSLRGFSGNIALPGIEVLDARHFTAGGEVYAERNPVLDLRVRACLRRGEIPMRIRFAPGRLHLLFDPSENRLAGMLIGAAGLSGTVVTERGDVNVRGVRRC